MADLNDEQWLDALSGREVKEMSQASAEELRIIRQTLLEGNVDQQSDASANEHAYQRLMFRMKREGLIGGAERRTWWQRLSHQSSEEELSSTAPQSSWRRFKIPISAAATLVLGTTVVLLSTQQPEETPDGRLPGFEMRGDQKTTQVLKVKDVEATLTQLKQVMDQAGIQYEIYPLGMKVGFEAHLPTPLPVGLLKSLVELRIDPPRNGALVLEIQATE